MSTALRELGGRVQNENQSVTKKITIPAKEVLKVVEIGSGLSNYSPSYEASLKALNYYSLDGVLYPNLTNSAMKQN
jgi:hypothetical protein